MTTWQAIRAGVVDGLVYSLFVIVLVAGVLGLIYWIYVLNHFVDKYW